MSTATVPARTASVAFILVTLVLDTLGIGLILPVLPRLITSLVHNDITVASRFYGEFVAVYALMQFVFSPVLGGLSDRLGRRPVLLASLLGAALDYLLLAFAPTLGWLFLGRVIAGLTGASFSTATAYIADVTPPARRAQSFGLMGAAFGVGFILGPALGGLLGHVSLRLPFLVAAGLNGLNCLYGLAVLPESLPVASRRPFSLARSNPLGSLANLGQHPVVLRLTATLVCSYMAQQILQSVWALSGEGRFGWREVDVGLSLAVVGVASGVVQGGLVRAILPRLGERRALLVGLLVSTVGFLGFGFATRGWMMYAIIVPFALGGIAGPAVQSLISRQVSSSEQGQLQGSLTSLQSLTQILAPLVGTRLYASLGSATAHPRIPGAPFLAAALFQCAGLLLALRQMHPTPSTAPPPPAAPIASTD